MKTVYVLILATAISLGLAALDLVAVAHRELRHSGLFKPSNTRFPGEQWASDAFLFGFIAAAVVFSIAAKLIQKHSKRFVPETEEAES